MCIRLYWHADKNGRPKFGSSHAHCALIYTGIYTGINMRDQICVCRSTVWRLVKPVTKVLDFQCMCLASFACLKRCVSIRNMANVIGSS